MLRILIASLILCGGALATETETLTIEGEVVDIGCYTAREAKGPEHQSCAQRCLGNGNPAGVLLDDGQVYTLAASAPAYTEFAARKVRVTGALRDKLLRPSELAVWNDGKWESVELDKFGAPKAPQSE